MPISEEWVQLSALNLGAEVLAASDDFFAPKENLLLPEAPQFVPGKYTDRGKWMDGWESRRRRDQGHDWCVIRLGLAGIPRGVVIDTAFFDGNHPESASLEGAWSPSSENWEELRWAPLLPQSPLRGNHANTFELATSQAFRLVRLNIFPDGGVARLRLYGEVIPDWARLSASQAELDLAGLQHGARVLAASDMHFGSRQNLILPGRPPDMREGWETRRRRGPGHDWCIVRLAAAGSVSRLELDTTHFKGNFPESASLEGCLAEPAGNGGPLAGAWMPLLERTPLRADHRHFFDPSPDLQSPINTVRLNIYPDGGVSRLRVQGRPSPEGWQELGLKYLNALPGELAGKRLSTCCGSSRWVEQMLNHRPFAGMQGLHESADRSWSDLGPEDYLEAFRSHPRIGQTPLPGETSPTTGKWSSEEQRGMQSASSEIQRRMQEGNQRYLDKFGFIFIVNATDKSAEAMLEQLEQRLGNQPDEELRIAAEQQRQITHVRLEKLFSP